MKKIIIAAATAAFLAAPGAALAADAKAPTTVPDCMKMLKDVGAALHKSNDPKGKLKKMRKSGQAMAKACKGKKFADAFKTYQAIAAEAAAK